MKKTLKKNYQKNYKILPLGKNQFKITATMQPIDEYNNIFSIFETHKKIVLLKNGDLDTFTMFQNLKNLLSFMSFTIWGSKKSWKIILKIA